MKFVLIGNLLTAYLTNKPKTLLIFTNIKPQQPKNLNGWLVMTINISKDENSVFLSYFAGFSDPRWVNKRLKDFGYVTINKVFHFTEKQLTESHTDEKIFRLGIRDGDYYIIDKDILNISYDLRIHYSYQISPKTFVASRGISVFKNLDAVLSEPITIGGAEDNSIPEAEFRELLGKFPTHTELNHYVRSRITLILKDYFETTTDAQSKFEAYLNKKNSRRQISREPLSKEYEVEKYEFIRDELSTMLKNADAYTEANWQSKILRFLLLLFPKYIAVLDNLHIKDFYSKPKKITDRYIDLTLVDVNGHIDIIEIKRPFDNCLISKGKYRDNFTPKKELSGSIMQLEKYIFHLSKWGRDGEIAINLKRQKELPKNLPLRITNPKGMIILGIDSSLTEEQLFDFEFIKRKYSNIIDIITYDDLLKRLDNIIEMMKR